MYILAVNISHHASVCLLHDGDIIFFLEEERVSKIKHHPVGASHNLKCLELIPVEHVDYLVICSSLKDNYIHNSSLVKQILNFPHSNYVEYSDHHLFHAASAFYNSGFDDAVCLVVDGGGWEIKKFYSEIESLYSCSYNNFDPLYKHYSTKNITTNHSYLYKNAYMSDSLGSGNLFRRFTKLLGLGYESGKLMGMSTYGSNAYADDWFYYDDTICLWRTNNSIINQEFIKKYSSFTSKANLAHKIQLETKYHTIKLLEKAFLHNDKVVLSGGYFQNCVNNYEYVKYFPSKQFFIDPICHDGGTSIGAAKYLWHRLTNDKTSRKLKTLYLG